MLAHTGFPSNYDLVRLAASLALWLCLGATGCTNENPSSHTDCVAGNEICGRACDAQTPCPSGAYCNQGSCTAECIAVVADNGQCDDGLVCTDNGRCQDPSCASVELAVDSITPSIELVIDRSGSMKWGFSSNSIPPAGEPSRWDAIKSALIGSPSALLPTLQNRIYFGALLYYYNPDLNQGNLQTIETTRGLNNSDAIAAMINGTSPDGGTPTSLAISRGVERFTATPPPANSPKYILLVTDGQPTVPGTGNVEETNGNYTVPAIQSAYQAGITTLVLGVTTQIAAADLQRFANAGIGLPPDGSTNAPFAVSNNNADLIEDLGELLGMARSCDLTLQGAVDPGAASSGTVMLNGQPLTYQTDWTLVDQSTLRLEGTACQTFLSAISATVSADFPCNAVVPIS